MSRSRPGNRAESPRDGDDVAETPHVVTERGELQRTVAIVTIATIYFDSSLKSWTLLPALTSAVNAPFSWYFG
ncbi:MAG TPA: hypothetical protein VM165_02910, partial [Planctomycetaceae bacterium]|nr:hypothetical protein [Planctomycetaceae bacterium]